MPHIEEVMIDVRDIDYTWFEGVKAFIDLKQGCYYLPVESAERLGWRDDSSEDYLLIDDHVRAIARRIELGGTLVVVWAVRLSDLVSRPTLTIRADQ